MCLSFIVVSISVLMSRLVNIEKIYNSTNSYHYALAMEMYRSNKNHSYI